MPILTVNSVPHAYDEVGSGPPLLLIHAGITDRRMWDDVMPALAERYRTIRFDLQGYGDTPLPDGPFCWTADARGVLDVLGVEGAHVIGTSVGAGIALDLAIADSARVDRLVLVAPGLPGWEWGDAMNAYSEAESAAVERGDLEEASWVNVRFWLDGSRPPEEVDPRLRQKVYEMQLRAFQVDNEAAELSWLVPNRGERLHEVTAPTLILVGERDQPDFAEMGRQMAERMPNARVEMLPGVAHLPPLEDPDSFLAAALPFLAGED
jgi:pimeloyl-ACP methyl ester carboxylesterase